MPKKPSPTEEMLKRSEPWRAHLRSLMNDPVYLEAVAIVKGEYECLDVKTEAPEIASVRALSMRAGFESFPIKLRALTEAPITAQKPLTETWGTKP